VSLRRSALWRRSDALTLELEIGHLFFQQRVAIYGFEFLTVRLVERVSHAWRGHVRMFIGSAMNSKRIYA
jgi:hypothetical protein